MGPGDDGTKMNLTTHMMFGAVVGAVLFGKPEFILLVGLGSAIPDLDREYGFLSEESFRRHQIHRALFHNFVFLGLVYLVNPFLCLGAFLHTFLDALTTAKDRGVEWLYPFTRMVDRTVYDSHGKKKRTSSAHSKVYLYREEPPDLEETSDPDLKPEPGPHPWRRTYGPAVSGRLLDEGVFLGSALLLLLLVLLSATGVHQFIDLRDYDVAPSFVLPVVMMVVGGFSIFLTGEIYRRRELREGNGYESNVYYRAAWVASAALMIAALVVGAVLNPTVVAQVASMAPFYLGGAVLIFVAALVTIRFFSKEHVSKKEEHDPVVL